MRSRHIANGLAWPAYQVALLPDSMEKENFADDL